MPEMERRTVASPVSLRTAEKKQKLVGHGAVFNQETVIYGLWREVIMPGAFTEAIKTDDVRALQNHNPDLVLGRNRSGTLRLEEDDEGLLYEIDPPDTTYAHDLMVVVDRGDVTQSSFQFSLDSSDWEEWDDSEVKKGKLPLRKIKRVRLHDVSPVTFAAFEGTDVQVSARAKDMAKRIAEASEIEARLAEQEAARQRADIRRRKQRIVEVE
jgi:uncharacterized protein